MTQIWTIRIYLGNIQAEPETGLVLSERIICGDERLVSFSCPEETCLSLLKMNRTLVEK